MIILAFDPSMTCTGYAAIACDPLAFVTAGTIKPDSATSAPLFDRVVEICDEAWLVYDELDRMHGHEHGAPRIVVEFPQTISRGMSRKRSASTAPNYGVICGALAMDLGRASETRTPGGLRSILTPSASEWTKGYPSTHKDTHKSRRVLYAAQLFGLKPEQLGPKSKAGNVADALLLAHWAAMNQSGKAVAG